MITANDYYRTRFGGKVYRLSLNGGMTCPNRDGTIDTRGCIFCSRGGSGDFAPSASLPIREQLIAAKKKVAAKLPKQSGAFAGYLAYFQAFTKSCPYHRPNGCIHAWCVSATGQHANCSYHFLCHLSFPFSFFQLNTLNNTESDVANSKIRNIEASVNTGNITIE